MFKNILVPTDGSDLSMLAVHKAIEFAKIDNARLTFFYAKPDHRVDVYGETMLADPRAPESYGRMAEERAQKILKEATNAAGAAGVDSASVTASTNAVFESIITAADRNNCDLIFMASHGRRGVSALLLGSETNKVLAHSRIPVLVYR